MKNLVFYAKLAIATIAPTAVMAMWELYWPAAAWFVIGLVAIAAVPHPRDERNS